MKRVAPNLAVFLMSLFACAGYSTQAMAEQAPVEDQSTISPTATSQPETTVDNAQKTYSRDLRVPYGGSAGVRNSNNDYSLPGDAIERPVNQQITVGEPEGEAFGQPAPQMSGNTQLFYKLQLLEQEVRELRGLVEEQEHKLDRLTREQKDRYLDIDRRLSQSVRGGPSSTSVTPSSAVTTTSSPGGRDLGPSTSNAVSAAKGDPESREYNMAFALTREKHYQEAIDGFTSMVNDYPNGVYTGSAFYWLGELYLALDNPDIEKSRQSFVQVVNLFPDHAKVPDSLYKLGVVYHRLGDLTRARQYLNQVTSQYPASASARLASSYLADLP